MKKFFMVIALAAMTMSASAQKVGVWYGVGFNKITGDGNKMYCAPLNVGVAYTQEMGNFDLTGGLSYRQKGSKADYEGAEAWKPGYLQLDVLGTYNFYKDDEGTTKFGVQTGPFVGLMVNKDEVDSDDLRKCDVGWQVGLAGAIKNFTISAGYEFGFVRLYKGMESGGLNQGICIKVGYQFGL